MHNQNKNLVFICLIALSLNLPSQTNDKKLSLSFLCGGNSSALLGQSNYIGPVYGMALGAAWVYQLNETYNIELDLNYERKGSTKKMSYYNLANQILLNYYETPYLDYSQITLMFQKKK